MSKLGFHLALIAILTASALGTPAPARAAVDADALSSQIASRIDRVEAFRYIREEARRLGARVWLFGGTAAGFGHYVRWDLEREKGDLRYQPERFDYHFSNIYRSSQDADIVIDGTPAQARQLQDSLAAKFPFLQGSKTAWEVRLLRSPLGDKGALLDNPDFLDQHTDSNSTGMIELSHPPEGEAVVRDLRDWRSPRPHFLQDLAEGRLHYYFSERHGLTSRFQEGKNPPILSVVRYLTKAFQYELRLPPEDLAKIREAIAEFDPVRDLKDGYVRAWIEKNGPKLFKNAVSLEYAARTLDELGLRERLIRISDATRHESLAWWLSRQPMTTWPLEAPEGAHRTAAELGIREVAHETNNFPAYESITLAHTGDPNVLLSRKGFSGEGAAYGDGFYTRLGREGAAGTGLTIRFEVQPGAREGVDFFIPKEAPSYVVFLNKAAFRVKPESLHFELPQYFEWLADGRKGFDQADRGVLNKLFERLRTSSDLYTPEVISRIRGSVLKSLGRPSEQLVLQEWNKRIAPLGISVFPDIAAGFEWAHRTGLPVDPRYLDLIVKNARTDSPEELARVRRVMLDSFEKNPWEANKLLIKAWDETYGAKGIPVFEDAEKGWDWALPRTSLARPDSDFTVGIVAAQLDLYLERHPKMAPELAGIFARVLRDMDHRPSGQLLLHAWFKFPRLTSAIDATYLAWVEKAPYPSVLGLLKGIAMRSANYPPTDQAKRAVWTAIARRVLDEKDPGDGIKYLLIDLFRTPEGFAMQDLLHEVIGRADAEALTELGHDLAHAEEDGGGHPAAIEEATLRGIDRELENEPRLLARGTFSRSFRNNHMLYLIRPTTPRQDRIAERLFETMKDDWAAKTLVEGYFTRFHDSENDAFLRKVLSHNPKEAATYCGGKFRDLIEGAR